MRVGVDAEERDGYGLSMQRVAGNANTSVHCTMTANVSRRLSLQGEQALPHEIDALGQSMDHMFMDEEWAHNVNLTFCIQPNSRPDSVEFNSIFGLMSENAHDAESSVKEPAQQSKTNPDTAPMSGLLPFEEVISWSKMCIDETLRGSRTQPETFLVSIDSRQFKAFAENLRSPPRSSTNDPMVSSRMLRDSNPDVIRLPRDRRAGPEDRSGKHGSDRKRSAIATLKMVNSLKAAEHSAVAVPPDDARVGREKAASASHDKSLRGMDKAQLQQHIKAEYELSRAQWVHISVVVAGVDRECFPSIQPLLVTPEAAFGPNMFSGDRSEYSFEVPCNKFQRTMDLYLMGTPLLVNAEVAVSASRLKPCDLGGPIIYRDFREIRSHIFLACSVPLGDSGALSQLDLKHSNHFTAASDHHKAQPLPSEEQADALHCATEASFESHGSPSGTRYNTDGGRLSPSLSENDFGDESIDGEEDGSDDVDHAEGVTRDETEQTADEILANADLDLLESALVNSFSRNLHMDISDAELHRSFEGSSGLSRIYCPCDSIMREGFANLSKLMAKLESYQTRQYLAIITREDILSVTVFSRDQLAERLGICLTLMKKIFRNVGLRYWPYRKLNGLRNKMLKIQAEVDSGAGRRMYGKKEFLDRQVQKMRALELQYQKMLRDLEQSCHARGGAFA